MRRDEFEQIRADVQTAMIEGPREDPSVTPQILFRLLDAVGEQAAGGADASPCAQWARALLRDVQLRATSKIPYGEPVHDDPPEAPRV